MQKKCSYIFVFLLINLSAYSQYSISGYINTREKSKTVFLSLLRFNEENAIYAEQVLISTKTDSTGYFEISGKLLPNENKLYRIHANVKEKDVGLDLVEIGEDVNYHNFIFSNSDTLYFPKGEKPWFSGSQNTNGEDKQWRKSINYERTLLAEFSKNKNADAIQETEKNFFDEFKLFCSDSLSGALVKLLAYSHIKRNFSGLRDDFISNPAFYNNLLKELNIVYSGSSYYTQFHEETSNLSASVIQQKYVFHKRLNYFLGSIVVFLFAVILFLFRRLRIKGKQETTLELSALTAQEEKVARLICEGKSNKEIAARLFISLSTVKSHIGSINSKLDVANRQQLIYKLRNHTRD
jgi:DNA-binding CsgD family transcriptional regulator